MNCYSKTYCMLQLTLNRHILLCFRLANDRKIKSLAYVDGSNYFVVSILFLLLFVFCCSCKKVIFNSPGPDWEKVKSETKPIVKAPGYGAPCKLDINTLGWEDGQFISSDGLTLYCFYAPLDLFSFAFYSSADPFSLGPYLRGPFQEIVNQVPEDFQKYTNQFLSSDILISHRSSIDDPFPEWSIAHFSTFATFDGAPQIILNDTNPNVVEFLVFTYLNPNPSYGNGKNDIAYYRNTSRNPSGEFTLFPQPLNEVEYNEDNPCLGKIGVDTWVLFFTSEDRPETIGGIDIFYSLSYDNANSWSSPAPVNFNSAGDEDMPFLWQDSSGMYWVYYMNNDNNIVKRRQRTLNDWKNWDEEIPIIDKGNALAVGEPTLTQWGDVVFGLIYDAGTNWGTGKTNRFDDDVWILPREGSPLNNLCKPE